METKLQQAARRTLLHLGATSADWRIIYDAIAKKRASVKPWGQKLTRPEELKMSQWRRENGLGQIQPKEAAAINSIATWGWIEEIANNRYYNTANPSSWRDRHWKTLRDTEAALNAVEDEPVITKLELKPGQKLAWECAQLQSELTEKMLHLARAKEGNIDEICALLQGAKFQIRKTGEGTLGSIGQGELQSEDGTKTLSITIGTQVRLEVINHIPKAPLIGSGVE